MTFTILRVCRLLCCGTAAEIVEYLKRFPIRPNAPQPKPSADATFGGTRNPYGAFRDAENTFRHPVSFNTWIDGLVLWNRQCL
ncbi:MAG: hypothetical protein LBT46_13855 [Planctomycetaceae bacterium]|nr:hypothetical protein [Planctomycetaceae bacterium]